MIYQAQAESHSWQEYWAICGFSEKPRCKLFRYFLASSVGQVVVLCVARYAAALGTNFVFISNFDYPGSAPYLLSPLLLRSAIITISYEDNANRHHKCVESRHIDKACKVIDG